MGSSYPSTCLSLEAHDGRVSDVTLHHNGCLRIAERQRFFGSLPPHLQKRILRQNARVDQLRVRLETTHQDTTAAAHLRSFKTCMGQWRKMAKSPGLHFAGTPLSGSTRRSGTTVFDAPYEDVEMDIKAPVIYLKDSQPCQVPGLENAYPNQKILLSDLLADDETRNPLMQPCEEGVVRYFHLPANNMAWVEVR